MRLMIAIFKLVNSLNIALVFGIFFVGIMQVLSTNIPIVLLSMTAGIICLTIRFEIKEIEGAEA